MLSNGGGALIGSFSTASRSGLSQEGIKPMIPSEGQPIGTRGAGISWKDQSCFEYGKPFKQWQKLGEEKLLSVLRGLEEAESSEYQRFRSVV